jgi:hypothetical protein
MTKRTGDAGDRSSVLEGARAGSAGTISIVRHGRQEVQELEV